MTVDNPVYDMTPSVNLCHFCVAHMVLPEINLWLKWSDFTGNSLFSSNFHTSCDCEKQLVLDISFLWFVVPPIG